MDREWVVLVVFPVAAVRVVLTSRIEKLLDSSSEMS